jgi:hypothetical protein
VEFFSHAFEFTSVHVPDIPNVIVVNNVNVIKYFLSDERKEGQIYISFSGRKISSHPGVHKSRVPHCPGDYFFYTMAPNICGPSVWNLLHVNIQTPRILRWVQNISKICSPLQ